MTPKQSRRAAAAVAAFSLMACSAGDEYELATEELAADSAEQQELAAEKVFEEQYSEGGTLSVYDGPGGLTVMVTGRIGVDNPDVAPSGNNLSELYLALRQGADHVPAEVAELSARLEAQRAARLPANAEELPRSDSGEAAPPADLVEKSYSVFESNVCIPTHFDYPANLRYDKVSCFYLGFYSDPAGVSTTGYRALDRSYTYNDNSSGQTRTRLFFANGQDTGHRSLFLSAGQWGFAVWPDNGTANARFHVWPSGSVTARATCTGDPASECSKAREQVRRWRHIGGHDEYGPCIRPVRTPRHRDDVGQQGQWVSFEKADLSWRKTRPGHEASARGLIVDFGVRRDAS
jgi:hypothetical protein